jgi:hypothetical protein
MQVRVVGVRGRPYVDPGGLSTVSSDSGQLQQGPGQDHRIYREYLAKIEENGRAALLAAAVCISI